MYEDFEKWLDEILLGERLSLAVSVDFNIRKAGIGYWSIEVKESDSSHKVHRTGDLPIFQFGKQAQECEIQLEIMQWLQTYMKSGKQAELLKKKKGFGVGFV